MPFDGSKTYKVTVPANIPAARFWPLTVYDNQTRSMLDTPQRYTRRQPELSIARGKGQCRWIDDDLLWPHDAPGVDRGNWIQTTPGRGWFTLLRLSRWRVGEIELVK
jgi:hypothetical protein